MIEDLTGIDKNVTGQNLSQKLPPMGVMPMYGTPETTTGIKITPSQEIYYCKDQMEELALSAGALIRQYLSKNDAVSSYETQIKYEVLLQSNTGLKLAFKCIKSAGYCCKGLRIQMINRLRTKLIIILH